jgi:hypothetical protein
MAKRTAREQRYKIDMSMQAWDLAKAGSALTIRVHGREGLLGTIEIGQGSFRWMTARSRSGFKRIRWRRLAEKLDEVS